MSRCRLWLSCLALSLCVAPAPADETLTRTALPGESPSAAQRLESARKLARDRQYAEAVDEYQRLLEEAGDKLAPLSEQQFVQVRWLCHLDLAALPPDALRLYRNRVDAQARKWFEQGSAGRDVALLRRVVDEAFCSRYGDQALDLLGDLAFEQGGFVEAERWWQRLTPPAARPLELVFPDPRTDPARSRAKQILARLFRPESEVSSADLGAAIRAHRGLHPDAAGLLAGRTGKYADTLQRLLDGRTGLAPQAAGWSTFGGSPSRNLVLPPGKDDPNRLARLVRRFRINVQTCTTLQDDDPLPGRAPSAAAARSLAFHPLIVDGQVLVANGRKVTGYDLRTARSSDWYDSGPRNADPHLPAPPDLRYTLTVADSCVLARLGVQGISPERRPADCESSLVCLSIKPDARGERLRWLARPEGGNRACAVFEGTPVAGDGRVYVAVARLAGGRTVTTVHCYPVQAEGEPPLRWRQDVCETTEQNGKYERCRHHLLTLAGPNVVYCSHSGAIVALDALTGRHVWARRYPSRGLVSDEQPSPRDLTPPVYADGRLFVAPADCDRLLCLDPATGQLLWQRDKVEVVHLLGVARGRLIFTTPQGIRALGAATGDDRDGWIQPDVGELPPFGRGFLAGDLVFWPTRNKLYVLDQADGQQPDDLHPGPWQDIPPGNLVYGDGCLVVAGEEALSVYVPPSWLRAERQEEVRQQPRSAVAHFLLALAEGDAGLPNRALADLDQAERLAAPGECWQGEALRELTRQARQRLIRQPDDGTGTALAPRGPELPKPEDVYLAPAAPPDLTLPLLHGWQVSLAAEECLLPVHVAGAPPALLPDGVAPEPVFFALGPELVCREAATGRVRWSRVLPSVPHWAGRHADTVVVAGRGGICCLRLDDGTPLWSFPVRSRQALTDFQLTASRLVCRQGARLAALELETGRVLWTVAAPSAGLGLPYPSGRFLTYHAGADWVVAQTGGGKLWVLDGRSGVRTRELETTHEPWVRPPLFLDTDRVCLVTDPRTVVLLDARAGKELARPPLVALTALSGRPLLLAGQGDVLLRLVDRNIGPTLQRLDPATCTPRWPEERLLGREPVAAGGVAFDRAAVYCTSGDVLSAHALADGQLLWSVPLPGHERGWRARLTRDYLVAYPTDPGERRLRCLGLPGSLALTAAFPLHERTTAGVPVLFFDLRTGQLVQRLNLRTQLPHVVANGLSPAEEALLPQLRLEEPEVALQLSAQGLVAALPGRAWGRAAAPKSR
jgi:outer membrane protein assembly factor BamB